MSFNDTDWIVPEAVSRRDMAPIVAMWLESLVRTKGLAHQSLITYREDFVVFMRWLRETGMPNLRAVTGDKIKAYSEYLTSKKYRQGTIQCRLRSVKCFYDWVEYEGYFATPYPRVIFFRGTKPLDRFIPFPKHIFLCRGSCSVQGNNLEKALAFEILLSTGMRIAELSQLRVRDVTFGDAPMDQELMKPSPFVGGSIILSSKRHTLKSLGRKVYFSVLAGELLKRYMKINNMQDGSRLPLFPQKPNSLHYFIREIGHGVSMDDTIISKEDDLIVDTDDERLDGFLDIDLDDLDEMPTNPRFRKLLQARQKEAATIPVEIRKDFQGTKVKRHLHPHALRHMHVAVMYYRNFHGERRAKERLMSMLGHSQMQVTWKYLSGLAMIEDDATWRQLWLGKPRDWLRARTET